MSYHFFIYITRVFSFGMNFFHFIFVSSPEAPHRLWGPSSFLFNENPGACIKWSKSAAACSRPLASTCCRG